ncbi:MAG: hypothetical protein HQ526_09810 [Actinobacteria bacterium]|nr:hypothetical protein [Actinomycetota bacterium]
MDRGRDADPIELADHPEDHRPWSPLSTGLATAALVILASISVWLFAPSDAIEIQPPTNLASLPYVDGVMVEVELPDLVMDAYTPVDGQTELDFKVRDADTQYFDVVHLRAHSSIGLPTRLFYEKDGDTLWAVYKEDAPANSAGG